MSTRPREAMTKASAFLVGSIVVACPPAISDTLASTIDRSLEECASNRKEDATGWQRLQLVLASRADWIEMCAKQIQSDLKAAADRDYESGTLTDQSFRRQRDDIDKHISNQKPTDLAVDKYNDPSIEQFIVVDDKAAEERTIETLPGYKTISK
jgi:sugar-specific transcriptional regulator TrmB